MNNFDRVNNSGINSEDMQLIKSYDAQIILNNDDKTLMQIGMKDFTVSVIKWKDSFYSEKPYEMAGLSGNGQLLPLYGVSDDVVHLKNLGEVKIILENNVKFKYIIRYIKYIIHRLITHESYGFNGL